jgi:hypothetical protein
MTDEKESSNIEDVESIAKILSMERLDALKDTFHEEDAIIRHNGKAFTPEQVDRAITEHFGDDDELSSQEKHVVEAANSGSWIIELHMENGNIQTSPRRSFDVRQMGHAVCSCGETFSKEQDVIEHLKRQNNEE